MKLSKSGWLFLVQLAAFCSLGIACADTGPVPFVYQEYEQQERGSGGTTARGGSTSRGGTAGTGARGGSTSISQPSTCELDTSFGTSSCNRCLSTHCCGQVQECEYGSTCYELEECRSSYCDGRSGSSLTNCMLSYCTEDFDPDYADYWQCRVSECEDVCE